MTKQTISHLFENNVLVTHLLKRILQTVIDTARAVLGLCAI